MKHISLKNFSPSLYGSLLPWTSFNGSRKVLKFCRLSNCLLLLFLLNHALFTQSMCSLWLLFYVFCFVLLFFLDTICLCSSGCHGTYPGSAFLCLGLKMCTTTTGLWGLERNKVVIVSVLSVSVNYVKFWNVMWKGIVEHQLLNFF